MSPQDHEDKPNGSAKDHYHIGKSEAMHEDIGAFLRSRSNDPATKVNFGSRTPLESRRC